MFLQKLEMIWSGKCENGKAEEGASQHEMQELKVEGMRLESRKNLKGGWRE